MRSLNLLRGHLAEQYNRPTYKSLNSGAGLSIERQSAEQHSRLSSPCRTLTRIWPIALRVFDTKY